MALAHSARVSRDPLIVQNPRVTDAVTFQLERERRESQHLVAAGYKTQAGHNQVRATLTGAIVMATRMATPWALVLWWRGRNALAKMTQTDPPLAGASKSSPHAGRRA